MVPPVLRKCGGFEGISFPSFFLPERRNPVKIAIEHTFLFTLSVTYEEMWSFVL